MEAIWQWGVQAVVWVQQVSGLQGAMTFFSFLGNEEFYLLFIPLLYWCLDGVMGLRLVSLMLFSNTTNDLLKLAFHAPRPYWFDRRVQAFSSEVTYGLPSGHSQNAVTLWGFLAIHLRRQWVWVVAVLLILAIAYSRLYLGMHFPTDVLAGLTLGVFVLWAFLQWEKPLVARWQAWSFPIHIALAIGVSLGYLAAAWGIVQALGGITDPAEWAPTAYLASGVEIAPRDLEFSVTNAGLLLGWGLSLALLTRQPETLSLAGGPVKLRLGRWVLGTVIAFALWRGLGAVFPDDPLWLAYPLRYMRYALVVLWLLYLAPRLFLRLKLMGKPG